MTRARVFIVLVLAVTAGGAFALATYNYVQKIPGKTVTMPTRPVVVAAADLDVGAELGRDEIRVIEWPANAVPATAISKPRPVSVVPLLVDPDEAERLTLAASEGKIQLALRNPLDKGTVQTRGIRPAALLGLNVATPRATHPKTLPNTAVPVPVAAAPALPTVEIIRGDKRAHEVVREEN